MRIARLLGLVPAILTVGLLVAPAAAADPPLRLSGYITDNAAALTGSGRGAVTSALDKLYADQKTRLWVVYVDSFSGQDPVSWAQATSRSSALGNFDALLAVATIDRAYAFLPPPGARNISTSQVDSLRRNQIEPALHLNDWSGAAVAAANGLDRSSGSGTSAGAMVFLIAAVVIAAVLLLLVMRHRRKRQRAAEFAAAQRVDSTDPDALAAVPLEALDRLSRSKVVDVDNALRTSTNELALAVDEFGTVRTEPFTRAVNNAKSALAQAFNVRQQLDDAIPETPAQQRDLLTRVIVSATQADRELEAQTAAFEKLRDLVINAPDRLDGLTQLLVELTARMPGSERSLAALHNEFDTAAMASVSANVTTAQERLSFADQNVSRARELAARPASGKQSELVDAVRAAESSLGQARALLDAVDSAATDIRHAVATLPASIADIEAGIARATAHLQQTGNQHTAELVAARDAAVSAVDTAHRSHDPLAAFAQLSKADADLDQLLATLAEEQATAERLNRALDQALFTAQSRVRGVSDYIDTRRGSIGPEARTRLAEATRQIEAAQAKRSTNMTEALAHANGAAMLAAKAQSLANADVRAAQHSYTDRHGGGGGNGAMIGGIIIGNILSGGMRGGFGGGWSPTSFGGSGSGGGGPLGGGGRF